MNTISKHNQAIEHHAIELAFAHIRIAEPATLKKMLVSIEGHGQLEPVIVVPAKALNRFTLIDGYCRVMAMKKLKLDVVNCEVWACSESDALLSLLLKSKRSLSLFEEAQIIRLLQREHQLTHEQIATQVGRARSWISYRLALLDGLPEDFIKAVSEGAVSAWSVLRILVPVARADMEHAKRLLAYLSKHDHSTRELTVFFKHYQKSNKAAREKMVTRPELFFKAQKIIEAEKAGKILKAGIEGEWYSRLGQIRDQIRYLDKLVPQLFYERQDDLTAKALIRPLTRVCDDLKRLLTPTQEQTDERSHAAPSHYDVASIGQELPTH